MGKVDADRGKNRPQQGDQQRCAITHQAMAQPIDGADRRCAAHRKQCNGGRLCHGQTQPQHQGRNRKNAATGAGQSEDQAHGHTKKTCQQHKTLVIREKSRERPVSMTDRIEPAQLFSCIELIGAGQRRENETTLNTCPKRNGHHARLD
ncbi:hypothetical protein D3C84_774540 [compost metagenome]